MPCAASNAFAEINMEIEVIIVVVLLLFGGGGYWGRRRGRW